MRIYRDYIPDIGGLKLDSEGYATYIGLAVGVLVIVAIIMIVFHRKKKDKGDKKK